MSEQKAAPNFEQIRKELCKELAHRLRDPKLTNERRLEILDKLKSFLDTEF